MHQIHFRQGLCPGPRSGSSRRCPRPLVGWGGGYPSPFQSDGEGDTPPHSSSPRRLRRLEATRLEPPPLLHIATLTTAYIATTNLVAGGEGARGPFRNNPTPVIGPLIRPRFYGSQGLTHYRILLLSTANMNINLL